MGRKHAHHRKRKRQERRAKRKGKRLAKRASHKAHRKEKHEQKVRTRNARKVQHKEKRKKFFHDVGKGAKTVFHEVKEDVINPAKNIIQAPANLMNNVGKSIEKGPGMTTMLMVGGVAVVAVMAMR